MTDNTIITETSVNDDVSCVVEVLHNQDGTSSTTNRSNNSQQSSSISILILGDGDLSWSLDFGRYLISISNNRNNRISSLHDDRNRPQSTPIPTNHTSSLYYDQIIIRVTGFDTIKQIEKKYPHTISFIIPHILKLNINNNNNVSSSNKRKRIIAKNDVNSNNIIISAKCNNSTDLSSSSLQGNNNQHHHHLIKNQQLPNNGNNNGMNNNKNISQTKFSFEIYDNVNAIVWSNNKNEQSSSSLSYHPLYYKNNIIIFNHPHLGIEDTILHRSFIHHLFYSIQNYWWTITTLEEENEQHINNHKVDNTDVGNTKTESFDNNSNNIRQIKNVFYLTLASGQYERWDCANAALKHQLVLLKRCYFIPHPSAISVNHNSLSSSQVNDNENMTNTNNYYYEQRRHQSGKSFAKRIDGPSETFIYTSKKFLVSKNINQEVSETTSILSNNITLPFDLPWFQSMNDTCKPVIVKNNDDSTLTIPNTLSGTSHICSYCGKSFHEQRSLKNHILCKHYDRTTTTKINNKNNKKNDDSNTLLKMTSKIEIIKTAHSQTIKQQEEEKEEQQTPQNGWTCSYCIKLSSSSSSIPRIFESHTSLMDHIRAKHVGIHTNISRDGERNRSTYHDDNNIQSSSNTNVDDNDKDGTEMSINNNYDYITNIYNKTEDDKWHCPICTVSLRCEKKQNGEDDNKAIDNISDNNVHRNVDNHFNKQQQLDCMMEKHLQDFIPTHGELLCSAAVDDSSYSCQFCQKQFSQNRSRLQHENFCKQR